MPGGPPTGGIIYHGDNLPRRFTDRSLRATSSATPCRLEDNPQRQHRACRYGGVVWDPHDTWSAPTDLCIGPDGAIYVADFFDERTAHPDPDADWDRSNGRIYKISGGGHPVIPDH